MGARLNGAVIDRYGGAACEAKLASDQADATYAIEITEIHPLGPWDYITDERTTTIDGGLDGRCHRHRGRRNRHAPAPRRPDGRRRELVHRLRRPAPGAVTATA